MSTVGDLVEFGRTGNLPTVLANRLRPHQSRRLYRKPVPSRANWSARRINHLHNELPQLRRYLEVGLAYGRTFENVTLPIRVGVDPTPQFDVDHLPRRTRIHVQTSDEFFKASSDQFDIVFLDGLHTYRQTYRDVVQTFTTSPAAVVLVDDVVPSDEVSAITNQGKSIAERRRRGLHGSSWHGDVFRMVPCLAEHHGELEFRTIVDRDNPQMAVWKREPSAPTVAVDRGILDGYETLAFSQVFADGVPASFFPGPESEALQAAVAALRSREVAK